MKKHPFFRSAFTLLEIMLVVMIIALLAGLAVWAIGDNLFIAQETKVKADLNGFATQLMILAVAPRIVPGASPMTRSAVRTER